MSFLNTVLLCQSLPIPEVTESFTRNNKYFEAGHAIESITQAAVEQPQPNSTLKVPFSPARKNSCHMHIHNVHNNRVLAHQFIIL